MPAEGVSATTASPAGSAAPDLLKPACVASAAIHTDYLLVRACADRRATFTRLQRSAGRRQHARSQIPKSQRDFGWVGGLSEKPIGQRSCRRSDEHPGCSVFRLSRHSMVFWCAMGVERSLAQYRICHGHSAIFFSNIVFGCMRCLRAGRDSHLCAGADLDWFGIAYGYFGGVRLLQIRPLISARPRRRWGLTIPPTLLGSADEVIEYMAGEKCWEFKPSSTLHGVVFDILFEGLQ